MVWRAAATLVIVVAAAHAILPAEADAAFFPDSVGNRGPTSESMEDTLQNKLAEMVTKIMLSDKMTALFADMFRAQADALKAEVRAIVAGAQIQQQHQQGAVSGPRHLTNQNTAVCTLKGCGDDSPCLEWNKVLEDVDNCQECATKKFYANGLLGCTCAFACEVPPAETAPTADATPSTSVGEAGIASDNLAGSSLWLGDDSGALAIGANADVRLFKNAEGAHGFRTNANFTIDGDVKVRGAVQVGVSDAMTCDSDASGTMRWFAEKKTLQVCEGESEKWKAAGGAVLDAADEEPCTSETPGTSTIAMCASSLSTQAFQIFSSFPLSLYT